MNIQRLILYTHALEAMKGFYAETLGLRLIMDRPLAFAVQIGGTMVEFHAWEQVCRYHFAINVPPGSIEAAHDWLAARTPILLRDGDRIVEFPNWKARAVYFHDPAGNIVELIARDEFDFHPQGEFDRDHLASISEIGLPAYDLEASLKRVLEETSEQVYWRSGADFVAVGDVEGLLLFVPADRWEWLPTGAIAQAAPCQFWVSSGSRFMIAFDEGEIAQMQVVRGI